MALTTYAIHLLLTGDREEKMKKEGQVLAEGV